MPYCSYCGKEVKEGDQFCPHCGAEVKGERRPIEPRYRYREERDGCFGSKSGYGREREACFGPPGSGVGLWGSISGGVFLIGLAVLWYYDWWWPGILFLIAMMVVIGGLVAYTRR